MKLNTVSVLFFAPLLFVACQGSESNSSMNSENKYNENYVDTKDVKLQYLDWGGTGEVLVLLCGLGDTPYLFDDLATGLSGYFHVIGYSRRFHGKSIAGEEKFDNATLVSDLKLLLDSLNVGKASLLGWSMGGNEITEFAVRFPDRVNKLIYFESGYDLSDGGFEKLVANIPQSFLPDSLIVKSLDNYREWYHHFWFGDVDWNKTLENNLLASIQVKSDGHIETIPNAQIFKSMLAEAMNYRRNYKGVQAPSLVIYSQPFFHPADSSQNTIKLYDSLESEIASPWRLMSKKRIEKELMNSVIVESPHGTHTSFIFLSKDFLINTISSFIKNGEVK